MHWRLSVAFAAIALTAGCVTVDQRAPGAKEVAPFSAAQPGDAIPQPWGPWAMSRLRYPSRYELVRDGNVTVLKAAARDSASGLVHPLDIDPGAFPQLTWRWKLMELPPVSDKSPDDSPVRLVVSFEGDIDKLAFGDRIFFANFHLFTGEQLPYAALMYIWGSKSAPETIRPTEQTGRIQMIVVDQGRDGLGKWREMTRSVREDFRRAFGEEPGRIISVGVLTETDFSARDVDAYYGDIGFRAAP